MSSENAKPAELQVPSGKFRCKYCPFASDEKSLVRWHESKHPRDKPLVCPVCNKSFFWRSSMAAHRRSHTGEQPYKCAVCSRGFSSTTNLARHSKQCQASKAKNAKETSAKETDGADPKVNQSPTPNLNLEQ